MKEEHVHCYVGFKIEIKTSNLLLAKLIYKEIPNDIYMLVKYLKLHQLKKDVRCFIYPKGFGSFRGQNGTRGQKYRRGRGNGISSSWHFRKS